MSERVERISAFYGKGGEDARLTKSRHGRLEYLTTMHYIHRFAQPGAAILEIGAGTGRYSIALAREGYEVTAVELVEQNLAVLKQNGGALGNLHAFRGDALDLGRFAENSFDMTLVLGPLYHLYEAEEVHRALEEAIRVTKKGGVIFAAFLSVHAILFNNYLQGNLAAGLEENFDEHYGVKHFEEQLFTGYDIAQFEQMIRREKVQYLTTASADSILELAEHRSDFQMSDEEFERFAQYHLATCEKRELLASASHLLCLCRKMH